MWETKEFKKYDVSELINELPIFENLKDIGLFKSVKVDCGGHGVCWNTDIDLSADELFENGVEWKDRLF